jgi:hypothetical protein
MIDYKRSLYSKKIDLASAEYAKARSEVGYIMKLWTTNLN